MAYKDTLTLYEELVATGIPDGQAKIQAHQHGGMIDALGEQTDLIKEIKKDLMWMRIIGVGILTVFMANFFKS